MTDTTQTIPEIIARDMSIKERNYSNMDGFYLKQWAKKGLKPAQQELERREASPQFGANNNTTGNKGVPRSRAHGVSQSKRIIVYKDNTEVEHDDA